MRREKPHPAHPHLETCVIINDHEYAILRQSVHRYISDHCIARGDMPGKMPGSRYTWMFYLRNALFNPQMSFNISKMFLYHMERIMPDFEFQVCGMETAGSPMVSSLTMTAMYYGVNLNGFICRKERKEYGLLNRFEGQVNGKIIAIMDDLCNSSKSMRQCLNALMEESLPVLNIAFCIINKSNAEHTEERKRTDMYMPKEITVVSLFNLDDFDLSNPSH